MTSLVQLQKNLPDDLKTHHDNVPWNEMYTLRNRVSHEYFGIDYDLIWDISVNNFPINKTQIELIITIKKSI